MATADSTGEPRGWARAGGVLWRSTHQRLLLLVPGSDDVVTVDGSGVLVWRLLEEPRTSTQLAESIGRTVAEPPVNLIEQLDGLLHDLARLGAVVRP